MARLSLVYPIITYRAKLKHNLSYVASDEWIVGQLYNDVTGKKYLLAGPENDEQQRFYITSDLRLETVGTLAPFKTNADTSIFDGDIIAVTAFETRGGITKDMEEEAHNLSQLLSYGAEDISVNKLEKHTSIPSGSKILFSAAGIVKCCNGTFYFEYLEPTKTSLGSEFIPLYQFYAPNMEPLDSHFIEHIGNIYDNPQLAQRVLYVSSEIPNEAE